MSDQHYQHPEFNEWLSPKVNPETYALFTESVSLLAQHAGTTDSLSAMLTLLVSKNEQGVDENDQVNYIKEQLMGYLVSAIQLYGVVINLDYEPTDHLFLNQLLSAIMSIQYYQDPMEIQDIIDLGNPNQEKFAEIVNLIEPDLYIDTTLMKVREVLTDFFTNLTIVLEPEINLIKLKQTDEEKAKAHAIKDLMYSFNKHVSPYLREIEPTSTFIAQQAKELYSLLEGDSETIDIVGLYIDTFTKSLSPRAQYHLDAYLAALIPWVILAIKEKYDIDITPNQIATQYGPIWFKGDAFKTLSFTQLTKQRLGEYQHG